MWMMTPWTALVLLSVSVLSSASDQIYSNDSLSLTVSSATKSLSVRPDSTVKLQFILMNHGEAARFIVSQQSRFGLAGTLSLNSLYLATGRQVTLAVTGIHVGGREGDRKDFGIRVEREHRGRNRETPPNNWNNGGRPDGSNGGRPDWNNGGNKGGEGFNDGNNGGRPHWNNGGNNGNNGGFNDGDNGGRPDWNNGGNNGGFNDGDNGRRPDWNNEGNNGGRPDWNNGGNNGGRPDWNNGGNNGNNGGFNDGDNGGRPDWNNGGNNGGRPDWNNGGNNGNNGGFNDGDNGGRPDWNNGGNNGGRPDWNNGGNNGGFNDGDNGGRHPDWNNGGNNGGRPDWNNGGNNGNNGGFNDGGNNGGHPDWNNGGNNGHNGGRPDGNNGGNGWNDGRPDYRPGHRSSIEKMVEFHLSEHHERDHNEPVAAAGYVENSECEEEDSCRSKYWTAPFSAEDPDSGLWSVKFEEGDVVFWHDPIMVGSTRAVTGRFRVNCCTEEVEMKVEDVAGMTLRRTVSRGGNGGESLDTVIIFVIIGAGILVLAILLIGGVCLCKRRYSSVSQNDA